MLTGKLVVGQSGGPTPVINASLAGVIQEAQKHAEIEAILGMVHGIEGALQETFMDLSQESPETVSLLAKTPASALGSCRHKVKEHEYKRLLQVCKAHNIRHFVYIGGNDSMDTCQRISKLAQSTNYEMQVIGVPKTVDNDLAVTDHTPGYGSAARFVALATRDTGLDMEAMATFEDVSILETMGRNAGWLTAASILGQEADDQAPHLIYVPEVSFNEEMFLQDVAQVHAQLGRVFVVVCEGLRNAQGEYVGQNQTQGDKDAFGHVLPTLTTGVASYLSNLVNQHLKLRSRFLRPVLIGRAFSACISETDRQEAIQVGKAAVENLARGNSGLMVTLERSLQDLYECEIGVTELGTVANTEKLLPGEFINPAGNGITEAFRAYALPLIGDPLPPVVRLHSPLVKTQLPAFEPRG